MDTRGGWERIVSRVRPAGEKYESSRTNRYVAVFFRLARRPRGRARRATSDGGRGGSAASAGFALRRGGSHTKVWPERWVGCLPNRSSARVVMVSVASTYVPPDASGASVLPFAPWSARRSASARAARRQRAEGCRDEAPRERDATMARGRRATEAVRGRAGAVCRARGKPAVGGCATRTRRRQRRAPFCPTRTGTRGRRKDDSNVERLDGSYSTEAAR